MNRRPAFWITGLAAALAVALVAAPVWDAWRYRRLRSPVGPHVPVGVILPIWTEPAAPDTPPVTAPETTPGPAPIARTTPSDATAAVVAAAAPTATPPASASHQGDGAPAAVASASTPTRRAEMKPGRAEGGTSAGRVAGPSESRREQAAEPRDPGAPPTGDPTGVGAIGWVAVPAPDSPPQPGPEPQDGPPPPRPASPTPGAGDPTPTPQAIPTLQLVPFRPALSVGDSLVVAVRLTGASNVTSLPFHVEFNPAVLEFQAVEEGPAVGGAMQPILLASVSPARPGDLAVGLSLIETGGLLQGAGTVLRLKFRAVGPGSSPLDFRHASIRGRMSEPLDSRFQNAAVEVH